MDFVHPDYHNLSIQERFQACNVWLENNPNHIHTVMVSQLRDAIAEISRKDAEISRMDAEMARMDAEMAQKDAQIASKSLRGLLEHYPHFIDRTISGFHNPKTHAHADVNSLNAQRLKSLVDQVDKLLTSKGDFWDATFANESKRPNCDSESSVLVHVTTLVKAILVGLKIDKKIGVVLHRTLAGVESDILLEYLPNRLIFAPIEVKKPQNEKEGRMEIFEGNVKNHVIGQMYNQLKSIQLFGYSKVFGMITTSNQFRLVCTDDFLSKAEDSDICELKNAWNELMERESATQPAATESDYDQTSNGVVIRESPNSKKVVIRDKNSDQPQRIVYASDIVPNLDDETKPIATVENSGRDIVCLLVLFILKSCATLLDYLNESGHTDSIITVGSKMPCRILKTNQASTFAFGTVAPKKVDLHQYNDQLDTIYVILHLGMGDSGKFGG